MTINVLIERLVLDGLPVAPQQGRIVADALQAELTRLLTDRPIGAQLVADGSLASSEPAVIQVPTCLEATGLGEQIATGVYSNLGGRQ
jgi:hypothetical protein